MYYARKRSRKTFEAKAVAFPVSNTNIYIVCELCRANFPYFTYKLCNFTDLKKNGNIFFIGLSIKTFEVIVTSVLNFWVTYLVSEILKTNDISHTPSCLIIRSIFTDVTTWVDRVKLAVN